MRYIFFLISTFILISCKKSTVLPTGIVRVTFPINSNYNSLSPYYEPYKGGDIDITSENTFLQNKNPNTNEVLRSGKISDTISEFDGLNPGIYYIRIRENNNTYFKSHIVEIVAGKTSVLEWDTFN